MYCTSSWFEKHRHWYIYFICFIYKIAIKTLKPVAIDPKVSIEIWANQERPYISTSVVQLRDLWPLHARDIELNHGLRSRAMFGRNSPVLFIPWSFDHTEITATYKSISCDFSVIKFCQRSRIFCLEKYTVGAVITSLPKNQDVMDFGWEVWH